MCIRDRFPPYEYYEDNKVTGIDMDIMQAIADELGMDMPVSYTHLDVYKRQHGV